MRGVSSKSVGRAGIAGLGAGIVLLLVHGPIDVSASKAHSSPSTGGAITCSEQRHLNDPTTSHHQVLTSYSFDVLHGGTTNSYCTLFKHVQSGDTVTAHFTFVQTGTPTPDLAQSSPSDELSLVSYTLGAESPKVQALLECASFSNAADGADACQQADSASLTVDVGPCGFQIDLVYGEEISPNHEGDYAKQHRWIDGMQGGLKNSCPTPTPTPTATPTPTPTPGGGAPGGTPTPSGGNGGGLNTPSTGAGLGGLSPTGLAGSLLVGFGIAATLLASRRSKGEVI